MKTNIDTSGELYFMTCLVSTLHQSTLQCVLYNGRLIVVLWVLPRESTCFISTILVSMLIPLVHSFEEQHLYILHTFIPNHNMLSQ